MLLPMILSRNRHIFHRASTQMFAMPRRNGMYNRRLHTASLMAKLTTSTTTTTDQDDSTTAAAAAASSSSSSSPDDEHFELPPPPENCCMSNCANCVWIVYAQELERLFHDGGTSAKKLILQRMEDPSMRAFLSLELSLVGSKRPPPPASTDK